MYIFLEVVFFFLIQNRLWYLINVLLGVSCYCFHIWSKKLTNPWLELVLGLQGFDFGLLGLFFLLCNFKLFISSPTKKYVCLPYCFLLILMRKQYCLLQYWQIIIDLIIDNGERITCLLDKIIKGDTTKSLFFFFSIIHIILKTEKIWIFMWFWCTSLVQGFRIWLR